MEAFEALGLWQWGVVALALPLGLHLIRCGVFARDAFLEVPGGSRPRLSGLDVGVGILLWFFGQAMAVAILQQIWGEALFQGGALTERRVEQMIVLYLLWHEPLLVYLLLRMRPPLDVWGPVRLGLAPSHLGPSLRWACRALVACYPIMMASTILGLLVLIVTIGYEPPKHGHGLLGPMVEGSASMRLKLLIHVAVLAPLFEELLFRGIIQSGLSHSGGRPRPWLGILVASVLFTGAHFKPDPTDIAWHTLPSLFVLSVALGWVYERTGSLWAPILMHALFNGSQVALVLMFSQTA